MQKADLPVDDLVKMISRGELRLPQMQRRYVWRASRVRDLLDSLYRGYPSGAILVWETDDEELSRDMSVDQESNKFSTQKLLLDGQQRLTSLFAVLRGLPVEVRNRKKPIEILFNLEHPEDIDEVTEVDDGESDPDAASDGNEDDQDEEEDDEESVQEKLSRLTFVVSSRATAALPQWLSVSDVMTKSDADLIRSAGVADWDDPRFQKYSDRIKKLKGIRNYMYVMHILERNLSYEEVAEIFVRVNSLGVKLRSSDLALAQITARWRDLLPLLDDAQKRYTDEGFDLDHGALVRAMVVFSSGQSRFKTVSSISTDRLRDGWKRAQIGLEFAIPFLKENAGIEHMKLLSSPFFLFPVAWLFEKSGGKISVDEERGLLEWVLVGSGRGYYSGSAESKLDADLNRISRGEGASGLVANLDQTFGRLRFNTGDIAGRGTKSGLYALTFLALRAGGAKDWDTGVAISLNHKSRQHAIQSHHIFPRALVRGRYDRGEINEIANRAFIGGKTNRRIGSKQPTDYLPGITSKRGPDALESQCVPTDTGLWELERYREFLAYRREKIVARVNEWIDGLAGRR